MSKTPISITDNHNQLRVEFDTGEVMHVGKNTNNAVRQKLERDYPELYPKEQ